MAHGCGWRAVCTVTEAGELEGLRARLRQEALFAVLRIAPEEAPRVMPPRDGALLHHRFRAALLGPEG